jgi:hypothetical protein
MTHKGLLKNFLVLWSPRGINQAKELYFGGPIIFQRLLTSRWDIDKGARFHDNGRGVYDQPSPAGNNVVDL